MGSRLQLDAQAFEKLLAAAFVVQQQRDRLRVHLGDEDSDRISVIAETQIAVQRDNLRVSQTMDLVAQRAWKLTLGTGAVIWYRHDDELICKACAGNSSAKPGERIPLESSVIAGCFHNGDILLCEDTNLNPRALFEALPQPAGGSLMAVPVHHEGKVAAVIEIFFAKPRGWRQVDIRTCQLLSGIIGESIARDAEQEWRQTLASERATMLAALERIQPHLRKLLEERSAPESSNASQRTAAPEEKQGLARLGQFLLNDQEKRAAALAASRNETNTSALSIEAWRLPHALLQESDPVADPAERAPETALNFASRQDSPPDSGTGVEERADQLFPSDQAEFVSQFLSHNFVEETPAQIVPQQPASEAWQIETQPFEPDETKRVRLQKFLNSHWADLCVGFSAIIFAITLWWALGSSGQTASSVNANTRPPELSPVERVLVTLGLAEAPARPLLKGNPGVRVWVDLQTALYYCPGTPQYGRTHKGRFASQEQAQREHFEAAARQPCP